MILVELAADDERLPQLLYVEMSRARQHLVLIVSSPLAARLMVEVGFAHRGEKLEPVWERAVRDVHGYWRDRPDEGVPTLGPFSS